jgi:UDP-MurNAc hydroxylase
VRRLWLSSGYPVVVRVTFLGQAGLYIEARDVSILCDPWFNPAYFASWFPFPANDGIDPTSIGDPTFLYVSHLHRDHFDPAWLRAYCSKDATVLLPAYPLDTLEKELRALGFRSFIKSNDREPFEAGGLTMLVHALVAPTDGPIGDSALLIDDGETRLLNMNDSRPTDPETLLALGPIDALFLQFSGAIWYPMVYQFPPRAIAVLAHKKRVAQQARAKRYIELLGPRFVVPSAGPPCFLDDELFGQNDSADDPSNIFPDQTVFLEYLAAEGVDGGRLMLPGSVGTIRPGSFEVRHPAEPDSIFGDKATYLADYRDRMRPTIAAERATWAGPRIDLLSEIRDWFEPLMVQADLIAAGIGASVMLDVGDERIVLDFAAREVRGPVAGEEPRYVFVVERTLVESLVRDHVVDWVNSLFLSMRFRARRRGAYNDYVYTFFKCLSEERIQYAEGFYAEQGPSEGTWEAAGYRIQRRCAHMKADLTRFASIENGVLTCQLHGWQWELASGRCLTSDGHQLYAVPVSEDDLPEAEVAARSA